MTRVAPLPLPFPASLFPIPFVAVAVAGASCGDQALGLCPLSLPPCPVLSRGQLWCPGSSFHPISPGLSVLVAQPLSACWPRKQLSASHWAHQGSQSPARAFSRLSVAACTHTLPAQRPWVLNAKSYTLAPHGTSESRPASTLHHLPLSLEKATAQFLLLERKKKVPHSAPSL